MKPDEMGLPKKESASAAPILAPNARKEVQKGLEAFEKSNLVLARKHFENALAMAPGNPDVQFLMGALEAQEKNFTAGSPAAASPAASAPGCLAARFASSCACSIADLSDSSSN